MLRYAFCVLAGLGLPVGGLMTSVMALNALADIGTCETNPAIQVLRPCPEVTLPLIGPVFGGPIAALFGAGLYSARSALDGPFADGPNWDGFWWPALFLAGAALFWRLSGNVEATNATEARVV